MSAYLLAAGRGDLMDEAELLVSELVTNAGRQRELFVINGDAHTRVRIVRESTVWRIEVYDGNPSPPPAPPVFDDLVEPDEDAGTDVDVMSLSLSGRGLPLVDAFALERGWTPYTNPMTKRPGKCVWFTMARRVKK